MQGFSQDARLGHEQIKAPNRDKDLHHEEDEKALGKPSWSNAFISEFREKNEDMFKHVTTWIAIIAIFITIGQLVFNWGGRVQSSPTNLQVREIIKEKAPTKEEFLILKGDISLMRYEVKQMQENYRELRRLQSESFQRVLKKLEELEYQGWAPKHLLWKEKKARR